MKTENPLAELYALLLTEKDRTEVLEFLNALADNLFKVNGSVNIIIQDDQRFGKVVNSLLPEGWEKKDKNSVGRLISDMKNSISAIKNVEIILAVPPNEKTLNVLSLWAASVYPEKMLLDVNIKPEIIGGVIIVSDGLYRDYSLAKKINEAFVDKRTEIEKLIAESSKHQAETNGLQEKSLPAAQPQAS